MIVHDRHVLYWEDCDKSGHEVGCYIASCEVNGCDWYEYDCDDHEKYAPHTAENIEKKGVSV